MIGPDDYRKLWYDGLTDLALNIQNLRTMFQNPFGAEDVVLLQKEAKALKSSILTIMHGIETLVCDEQVRDIIRQFELDKAEREAERVANGQR